MNMTAIGVIVLSLVVLIFAVVLFLLLTKTKKGAKSVKETNTEVSSTPIQQDTQQDIETDSATDKTTH